MLTSSGPAGPLVRRLLVSVVVVPPAACEVLRLVRSAGVLDKGDVIVLIVAAVEVEGGRLDDAQAIAHLGSWPWEPETDHTQWSAEMYRVFDREPAQGPAASEPFFTYLHPDDHDRIAAGYANAFGAGAGCELA